MRYPNTRGLTSYANSLDDKVSKVNVLYIL
jgi:hypothetical protein